MSDTVVPQDLQVLSDEDGDRFVVIGTTDTETAWLAVQAQFIRDGVDADNWGEPNRYETGRDWVWRHDGEDGDRWLERRPPLSIDPAFAATVVIFMTGRTVPAASLVLLDVDGIEQWAPI